MIIVFQTQASGLYLQRQLPTNMRCQRPCPFSHPHHRPRHCGCAPDRPHRQHARPAVVVSAHRVHAGARIASLCRRPGSFRCRHHGPAAAGVCMSCNHPSICSAPAQMYWHTSAHVLGAALEHVYGDDMQLCDGPALKEGCDRWCFDDASSHLGTTVAFSTRDSLWLA